MKAVMISIRPEWCQKIASGEKTLEVRKNLPSLETPFKCYIYCTDGRTLYRTGSGIIEVARDKRHLAMSAWNDVLNRFVIAEFICDKIIPISVRYSDPSNPISLREFPFTCLTDRQIMDYLGNGGDGYGWHISDLKIYEKPKNISDFAQCHKCEYSAFCRDREYSCDGTYVLHRAPQSWCYVEDVDR